MPLHHHICVPTTVPVVITDAMGITVLPHFLLGEVVVSSGILARVLCGLPTDAVDVDLLMRPDVFARMQKALMRDGYDPITEESDHELDDEIQFRSAWRPPYVVESSQAATVDLLALHPIKPIVNIQGYEYVSEGNIHMDARNFIETFDCAIVQQILGIKDGSPYLSVTRACQEAHEANVPGWLDTTHTPDQRKHKWDTLLPGTIKSPKSRWVITGSG